MAKLSRKARKRELAKQSTAHPWCVFIDTRFGSRLGNCYKSKFQAERKCAAYRRRGYRCQVSF